MDDVNIRGGAETCEASTTSTCVSFSSTCSSVIFAEASSASGINNTFY